MKAFEEGRPLLQDIKELLEDFVSKFDRCVLVFAQALDLLSGPFLYLSQGVKGRLRKTTIQIIVDEARAIR